MYPVAGVDLASIQSNALLPLQLLISLACGLLTNKYKISIHSPLFVAIQCPDPADVDGHYTGQDRSIGATVELTCNTSYTAANNTFSTCQSDGTWRPPLVASCLRE